MLSHCTQELKEMTKQQEIDIPGMTTTKLQYVEVSFVTSEFTQHQSHQ